MDKRHHHRSQGIQAMGELLMVNVPGDTDEDGLVCLKKEILVHLAADRFRGVLVNLSDVTILGSYGFTILRETARSVEMMGAKVVFVGVRPGVAAALVEFELDFSGICTAVTMADAMALIGTGESKEDYLEDEDADPAPGGPDTSVESGAEPNHGPFI